MHVLITYCNSITDEPFMWVLPITAHNIQYGLSSKANGLNFTRPAHQCDVFYVYRAGLMAVFPKKFSNCNNKIYNITLNAATCIFHLRHHYTVMYAQMHMYTHSHTHSHTHTHTHTHIHTHTHTHTHARTRTHTNTQTNTYTH